MGKQVHILPDLEAVSQTALQRVKARLGASRGKFRLALAGGSTPRLLYQLMAEESLDWDRFEFWWGDERYVPHDHQDSNYRMAREALLDRLELNGHQVRPWPYLDTAEASAKEYQKILKAVGEDGPRFDLVLLGMGDDGHTASLFPGTSALDVDDRLAVANWVEAHDTWRLTLTYPALSQAQEILFLVCGESKAKALGQVINQGRLPSAKVRCQGDTVFLVDQPAAALLS